MKALGTFLLTVGGILLWALNVVSIIMFVYFWGAEGMPIGASLWAAVVFWMKGFGLGAVSLLVGAGLSL